MRSLGAFAWCGLVSRHWAITIGVADGCFAALWLARLDVVLRMLWLERWVLGLGLRFACSFESDASSLSNELAESENESELTLAMLCSQHEHAWLPVTLLWMKRRRDRRAGVKTGWERMRVGREKRDGEG